MLRFLFPRLTSGPKRGTALFESLVAEARRPHWYVEGEVADTIDGRFAVLATLIALASVRLERGGEAAERESVALTERFIEAMDAEHREIGLGDPTLGKRVRKLVGSLARRVALWRETLAGEREWRDAVAASLFRGDVPSPGAADHCEQALRRFMDGLDAARLESIAEGRLE